MLGIRISPELHTMRIVGNNARDYNNFRNINSVPFQRYQFQRIYDYYNLANFAYFRLKGKSNQFYLNYHRAFWPTKADVLHFFNKVSGSKKPWISTFETALPRWDTSSEKGLSFMAGKYCHRLIAMSQAAMDIQLHFLAQKPQFLAEIAPKLQVLHPGQKLLIQDYADKPLSQDRFEFTLIGNQIFSKGGREAVRVTHRLYEEGYPVQLNLVSAMQTDNYATFTTQEDVELIKKEIGLAHKSVNFLGRIPNHEVLELLKRSHVSLLPTYADTYGYAVLEAQAAGCPVITTDIRALPEINRQDCGWLIEVPKNHLRNGILATPQERSAFYETVEAGLYRLMKWAMDNPAEVAEKGRASLQRIAREHNPADKATILESIYDEALKG